MGGRKKPLKPLLPNSRRCSTCNGFAPKWHPQCGQCRTRGITVPIRNKKPEPTLPNKTIQSELNLDGELDSILNYYV